MTYEEFQKLSDEERKKVPEKTLDRLWYTYVVPEYEKKHPQPKFRPDAITYD